MGTSGKSAPGPAAGRGVLPWTFLWFGRLGVYVARFQVGLPPPSAVVNGGTAYA